MSSIAVSTRALIVDDDPIYRKLVGMVLRNMGEVFETYEARSCAEAISIAREIKPDFCAIDWMLDDGEGVALGRTLLSDQPELRMTLMTAFPSKDLPRELIRAGFSGYIDKSASVDRVAEAFREVLGGGLFFAASVAPWSRGAAEPDAAVATDSVSPDRLTPRERQIVCLVARGRMTKEIAYDLQLSPRTVDKHRASILRKLNLHDVASLTRWSLRVGLVAE